MSPTWELDVKRFHESHIGARCERLSLVPGWDQDVKGIYVPHGS